MAKLAIRGHATRGNEVIKLLEMLGGKNDNGYLGVYINGIYFINENGYIEVCDKMYHPDYLQLSLEEFEDEFPYKVGDEVIIKKKNQIAIVEKITWCCDTITYWLKYGGYIEGNWRAEHLQPYKEETMEDKLNLLQQLKEYFDSTPREIVEKEWHEYDKYNEISPKVNEYLEYVNNIRQTKYPTTYEECCELLGKTKAYQSVSGYRTELLEDLQKLLICRDAYWKIAGEQMGLGKPWEPDYANLDTKPCYYTIIIQYGDIIRTTEYTNDVILTFPTIEMREAFYDNFKDLIEKCKELL